MAYQLSVIAIGLILFAILHNHRCSGNPVPDPEADRPLQSADDDFDPALDDAEFVPVASDRRKRFAMASPYSMMYRPASGTATALSAGNALSGITQTNGQTFTNPFGMAMGVASGMSQGYMPSSQSVSNSASQGAFRRKREVLASPYLPSNVAAGISTSNAMDGDVGNQAASFADPFEARSMGMGMASGYGPVSYAGVNSADSQFPLMDPSYPFGYNL
ncbi:uncharacterized protein LOC129587704 [Paramacrobiotus metropolitanus]|uniref:uncharacterized protein LOC129587704 n=1 Tax=Paramacrobiotus metropolitanus TaxID=2943436 RepID=UPI00244593D5|nr:uncharacterized protein LOC129587704 [Paramacrobiotus metropolitanus]